MSVATGRTRLRTAPYRWALLAALLALALVCTVTLTRNDGASEPQMSDRAKTYLDQALDLMETKSLLRKQTDWKQLRASAHQAASGAMTTADTYPAITDAVRALGDLHSYFWTPEQARTGTETTIEQFPELTSRRLPNGAGYLTLPPVSGSEQSAAAYVRQGREAVRNTEQGKGACGWVIDLRRNTGGNMWPMLTVVAPILGDGEVGSFIDADGTKTPWTITDATPSLGGQPFPWGPGSSLRTAAPPVAVLTDGRTASAAEAVLVAFKGRPDTRTFGTSTRGVPTANEAYPLPDGAILGLTGARDADRTGESYDQPIRPDQEVATSPPDYGTDQDRTLQTAAQWLSAQCGATVG
ncbi:S41 family peptidase [Kitasatospora sp. NPDC096077]|uniref:S41 family peptidase n=1 Tax=Kitasatospora sp. NPDC096077 TaxID=3155544 RepID=UPI003324CB43